MKNIKIVLIFSLAYFTSYAQDPQLFENTWYLQDVVINELVYLPPNIESEPETGSIHFNEKNDVVNIDYCSKTEALINYQTDDNVFTIEDNPVVLIGDCLNPENNIFAELYSSVFFDQGLALNPFTYTIINLSEVSILYIVNSVGIKAVYVNRILSNQDFISLDFSIYPNPVTDYVTIESISQHSFKKINVYDALGRLVLEQKNPSNQLDVSNLDSGLLFLIIETDIGVTIKRLIKN